MKRLLVLLLMVFALSGCGNKGEETSDIFTLTEEEQSVYENLIEETLNSFYWYYDHESLAYFSGVVPPKNENDEDMFAASLKNGFDMSRHSGKEAVVYTADLMHFNGNKAGTAYFYFIKNNIVGGYYVSDLNDKYVFDFNTRNVFTKDVELAKTETNAAEIEYKKVSAYSAPNGFISQSQDDKGNGLFLNIENNRLLIYKFSGNRFILSKSTGNVGEGLVPISAAFLPDGGVAVIAGRDMGTDGDGNDHRTISEKVVFLDKNYTPTGEEMILAKSTYSCVASHDENLILINERTLEVYAKKESAWSVQQSYNIGVQATAFKAADINGNGNDEYLITDGKDFFVFKQNGISLSCIWRTNISVESFYGSIYVGDLNGDEAPEIYIADNTGTAIKYTLAEYGLVAKNEDIAYGDCFYVADFNGDGLDDYIKNEGAEKPVKTVYIAIK